MMRVLRVHLDPDVLVWLQTLASESGVSASAAARAWIHDGLRIPRVPVDIAVTSLSAEQHAFRERVQTEIGPSLQALTREQLEIAYVEGICHLAELLRDFRRMP